MKNKEKFCCEQHMDKAFDDFLVQNETFPYLEQCNGNKCSYCDNEAKYILKYIAQN